MKARHRLLPFSEAEVAVWAEPGSACYFHGLWSHSKWMQKSFNGFMRNVFTDESKPKQFNKTLSRGREALYHTQRLNLHLSPLVFETQPFDDHNCRLAQ